MLLLHLSFAFTLCNQSYHLNRILFNFPTTNHLFVLLIMDNSFEKSINKHTFAELSWWQSKWIINNFAKQTQFTMNAFLLAYCCRLAINMNPIRHDDWFNLATLLLVMMVMMQFAITAVVTVATIIIFSVFLFPRWKPAKFSLAVVAAEKCLSS